MQLAVGAIFAVVVMEHTSFYDTFMKSGADVYKRFQRRREERNRANSHGPAISEPRLRESRQFKDPKASKFWEYIIQKSYRNPLHR